MVKKSASLAGKGLDILFGDKPAADAASLEQPAGGSPAAEQENSDMDAQWAAMLETETASALAQVELSAPDADADIPMASEPEQDQMLLAYAPAMEGEAGAADLANAPAVTGDQDMFDLANAPAVETPVVSTVSPTPARPAEPVAPAPQPGFWAIQPLAPAPMTEAKPVEQPAGYTPPLTAATPPAPMPSAPKSPDGISTDMGVPPIVVAPLPPPRDKTDAAETFVRAKLSGTLYDSAITVGSGAEIEPTRPKMADLTPQEIREYEKDQPSRQIPEEDVLKYVGHKQRQALWDEINSLYEQVPLVLSTFVEQKDALRLLREAQDILMEKPRQFDIAKYQVSQVKTILERRKNITHWTDTWAWIIFAYDLVWITTLGYLILFFQPPLTGTNLNLWITLIWGGVGGVVNGFYGLYKHASQEKDFDKQYVMWYVAQPIIGILLGGMMHLILGTGFLSSTGVTISGKETEIPLFPSLLAFIGGFRQEFVLKLIDGIVRLLTPGKPSSGSSSGIDLGASS